MNYKKKTLISIFKDLINQCDRIKFDERAIIRIIRINQEIFINKKFENWMREQEISENWSTKNILKQNAKFKRFDDMLIEKTKCIKKHVKLSKNLYSECYLVAAHILNRTSSSSLSWDSLLIFMQKLLKKSIRNEIVYFIMFDCKTFSLLKKINAFKKNEKMKSRAFIEYLIKYDFINIFRVWNSKKDDVNDYRDVIFNETKFFDTYKKVDLFKKKKKNFMYRIARFSCKYLKTTMKSNTTKFQYGNSFWIALKRMLSRSRWWKKKSHHQKNLNYLRLTIHHRLNLNQSRRLTFLWQSKYRNEMSRWKTKKWFFFSKRQIIKQRK
jgi:hypothetical protein